MAIVDTDWSIDRQTGNIRYIGNDHVRFGGATPSYATVIELHRWLQGLADNAEYTGNDEMDIINTNPSSRSTDNIITLLGTYNIDAGASEHLYDGTIIQGSGGTLERYDGIVNFGAALVYIQIHQNGAVLSDDWWNLTGGGGLNADTAQGISHRFMIKTINAGSNIDGRRLIGTTRTFGNTYAEFKINGTSSGNNVLALTYSTDLNNDTSIGTVGAWTDIYIDRTASGTTVNGVNNTGQNVLNVASGAAFADGDFIMVAGDQHEYKIVSIATNALTLNRNLEVATTGGEIVYDLNIGFTQIDVDLAGGTENYYARWDRGAKSINQFYEYLKYLSRDGSTSYIYGIPAELFRGITHQITVDGPTGTFDKVEGVSWTGGTGQMLAINSPTAATLMWIQILTGVAPTNDQVITGANSGATATMNVTITERPISTPFVGASTGSALIGSYGLVLQTTDLTANDTVFDLTNTAIFPPNNVTFNVGGLVIGEDRVLVGPWDGVTNDADGNPEIDYNQMTLNGTLSGATVGSIVVTGSIPADTPLAGTIRVQTNSGFWQLCEFTSWTGSTFTISPTEDFSGDNATSGNSVFISYIDKLATAATESFTGVFSSTRDLVVKVRDGGGSPIKEYITSSQLTANGGGVTAIRTIDA